MQGSGKGEPDALLWRELLLISFVEKGARSVKSFRYMQGLK